MNIGCNQITLSLKQSILIIPIVSVRLIEPEISHFILAVTPQIYTLFSNPVALL